MFSKRIKSVLTMGLIACTLIFVACEKENTNTISVIKAEKSPGGKSVIAADAKGAIDGAAKGSSIGNAIGGSTGAGWGALIGGIIGGTAASVDQYRENHPVTPPAMDTNTNLQQTSCYFPDSIKNSSNPYDYVGQIHYDIVAHFLANAALCQTNDGELNLSEYYTTVFNMLINNYPSLYITSNMQNYFGYADLVSVMNDLDEDFSIIASNSIQDNNLRQVITSYQQFFDNTSNAASFCPYSITVENQILSNSSYSDIEKQIALSYMATARYGFWFWENYCGGF